MTLCSRRFGKDCTPSADDIRSSLHHLTVHSLPPPCTCQAALPSTCELKEALGTSVALARHKHKWMMEVMQTITKLAAQLLQEKWSIVEDFFWIEAATVHCLEKRSQPCDSQVPESKRLCAPHMASPSPEPELGQQCCQSQSGQ
jgi:hypothetical protein